MSHPFADLLQKSPTNSVVCSQNNIDLARSENQFASMLLLVVLQQHQTLYRYMLQRVDRDVVYLVLTVLHTVGMVEMLPDYWSLLFVKIV